MILIVNLSDHNKSVEDNIFSLYSWLFHSLTHSIHTNNSDLVSTFKDYRIICVDMCVRGSESQGLPLQNLFQISIFVIIWICWEIWKWFCVGGRRIITRQHWIFFGRVSGEDTSVNKIQWSRDYTSPILTTTTPSLSRLLGSTNINSDNNTELILIRAQGRERKCGSGGKKWWGNL